MINFPSEMKLRWSTLLISTICQYLLSDPRGFYVRLTQRMSESHFPLAQSVSKNLPTLQSNCSKTDELSKMGELTKAIELIEDSEQDSILNQSKIDELRFQLHELKRPAIDSPTCSNKGGKHRVLHVLTNSLPHTQSGYTLRSHNVLSAQKNAGIECAAVTRIGYPLLVGKFPQSLNEHIDGIDYYRVLPWVLPRNKETQFEMYVNAVCKIANEFGATAIQTTTDFKNAQVASAVAVRLGIPWVYELRGELESTWLSKVPLEYKQRAGSSEFYQLARVQETAQMKSAARLVALSHIYKSEIAARGIDPEKVTVVPNSIDSAELERRVDREKLRGELGLENCQTIGTVSSLVGYEGIDDLIESLLHLPEAVKLLVVGDGEARPRLEAKAKELNLESRVRFVGRQPHSTIWKWYAALDVFVIPRKDLEVTRRVTPIKGLHAQALGIPVVASDLPAIREVTGGCAQYVHPESPELLAAAIQDALNDSNQERAKEWAASRTWDAAGKTYKKLYDELVATQY